MNARQLIKIGCPEDCIQEAINAIRIACENHVGDVKGTLKLLLQSPEAYKDDPNFGGLVNALIENREFVRPVPISYKVWGTLEEGCATQMQQACSLPMAASAAVMSDNHQGYGICIGGVLALKDAVSVMAIGVDIACRMSLSILDLPVSYLDKKFNLFKEAIDKNTRFGMTGVFDQPKCHSVMDEDWDFSQITRQYKDRAREQLGTSGGGNHFVDFGIITMPDDGLLPAGEYVAVMSHSGSRGTGNAVAKYYHSIAQSRLPKRYADLAYLAWLDMESQEGQEYWKAMELMGQYASANHELIHKGIKKSLGANVLFNVENHHNFAYREQHPDFGEIIVHRKGATPAGKGVLGVIPGSMATPAYIVRGKGNIESLNSASHGAGRLMSRKKAKEKYVWKAVKGNLENQGVVVLDATADESPGVYKDIDTVMAAQSDLVEIVARFDPKIVKMCGGDSQAED